MPSALHPPRLVDCEVCGEPCDRPSDGDGYTVRRKRRHVLTWPSRRANVHRAHPHLQRFPAGPGLRSPMVEPLSASLLPPTYSFSALPTTAVRAAVDVQNLARDLPRVSQIQNGVDDVAYLSDASHRLQRTEISLPFCSCSGVSTTPGATALKRIPCFAYSIARCRVTVFKPPFVIMETEPFTPAIGLSASAAEIVTTQPILCFNISSTASCVMWRNPNRLTDTSALKSSVVNSVNGFVMNMPALFTRTSMLPNCAMAALTVFAAVFGSRMSPLTTARSAVAVNVLL